MQQSQPPVAQPRKVQEPLPEAREVVAGIWKITVPIPFPLRTVNVFALVGKDGWAMVDTSMGTPDTREALWRGLERAGLSMDNLRTIVLTHHHPDHVGLSGTWRTRRAQRQSAGRDRAASVGALCRRLRPGDQRLCAASERREALDGVPLLR